MNPLSFGLGVIVGFLVLAAWALLLAYRDGHPFGEFVPDDENDEENR